MFKSSVRSESLSFQFEIGLFGIGLRADRYIFTSCHRHRSRDEAETPAIIMPLWAACAAATPSNRLAVDITPSFAPSTDARSQPVRCVRCCSLGGIGILGG